MNVNQLKRDIFAAGHTEKQCMAAYQMRFVKNNSEIVSILFDASYQADDPRLQEEAVLSLRDLTPDCAFRAFVNATKNNRDKERRCRGYLHLGTLGNPRAINYVLNGLSDSEISVRRCAIKAIKKIGNTKKTLNVLQTCLNNPKFSSLHKELHEAISAVKNRIQSQDRNCDINKNNLFNKRLSKAEGQSYWPTAF